MFQQSKNSFFIVRQKCLWNTTLLDKSENIRGLLHVYLCWCWINPINHDCIFLSLNAILIIDIDTVKSRGNNNLQNVNAQCGQWEEVGWTRNSWIILFMSQAQDFRFCVRVLCDPWCRV